MKTPKQWAHEFTGAFALCMISPSWAGMTPHDRRMRHEELAEEYFGQAIEEALEDYQNSLRGEE